MKLSRHNKILVTGASGSIGTQMMRFIARGESQVIGLDRQIHKTSNTLECKKIALDLLNTNATEVLFNIAPDLIVHCAAMIPENLEGETAEQAGLINRKIDDVIISYCVKSSTKLVFLSSIAVYGNAKPPWNEDTLPLPQGAYSKEKLLSEQIAYELLGSLATSLRISAPYGPGMQQVKVMEIFLKRALQGQDLFFHGSGARTQTFVHLDDICSAVGAALKKPQIGGVFNVAGEKAVNMKRLAELAVQATGSKSKILASGREDPGEHYSAQVDIRKMAKIMDWRPSVNLETGMKEWADILKMEIK